MSSIFLQAEWKKLVMANFAVEPRVLEKFLPAKVELDLWKGTCYISLVGFMFLNTRVKGIKIPFHVNFEEANLRFYVRYLDRGQWKRGVVFIKEIVSKPALTFVANTVYKENYQTMPMSHEWKRTGENLSVEYKWKKKKWNSLKIIADNTSKVIPENSEEEFITEHYWGYTKVSESKTSEYGVEHPRWNVYKTKSYQIDVDFAGVYGEEFRFLNSSTPNSVFLAEGSEITVKSGRQI